HRPEAVPRLDRTLAHHDAAVVDLDDAAGDDARIVVVDGPAARADVAWQVIAFRYLQFDRLGAGRAKLHAPSLNADRYRRLICVAVRGAPRAWQRLEHLHDLRRGSLPREVLCALQTRGAQASAQR